MVLLHYTLPQQNTGSLFMTQALVFYSFGSNKNQQLPLFWITSSSATANHPVFHDFTVQTGLLCKLFTKNFMQTSILLCQFERYISTIFKIIANRTCNFELKVFVCSCLQPLNTLMCNGCQEYLCTKCGAIRGNPVFPHLAVDSANMQNKVEKENGFWIFHPLILM